MYTAVAVRQAKKAKRKHVNKWSTPSTATVAGTAATAATAAATTNAEKLLLSKNAYMSANGVLRPLGSSSKKRKAQCECGATSRLYQVRSNTISYIS
jgi:hypothetical protein